MRDLGGKVAVVTGGGSGIGSGLCRGLAAEGARVVVADVDVAAAESVAAELRQSGTTARAAVVDVSQLSSIESLAARVLAEFGTVDVVCNNAGVYLGGPARELTPDDWRWIMSVNLDGVFHGCHVFTPLLLERGSGHILNTASVGGFLPSTSAYSSSKAGVVAYSEVLRADLEPDGIGVSILCPGAVRTQLPDCERLRPAGLSNRGNRSEVLRDMIKDGITPDEAGAIAVRGIQANATYIFTDPAMRPAFEKRFGCVLDAMKRP